MKKITQLLVLAMLISATTFANNINDNVDKNIQTSFSERFSGAKEVFWSSTDIYIKASFQMNGQFIMAYFTKSGELMGTARNLISQQLPLKLQTEIKKNLEGAWISELFEYGTDDDTTYYITLENGDQKILLKSINSHSWMVIKKSKKN